MREMRDTTETKVNLHVYRQYDPIHKSSNGSATALLELTNTFSRVAGYYINISRFLIYNMTRKSGEHHNSQS